MARYIDLTGENVTRQRRKERTYGTKTDLASSTIERGSTHWTDGSQVHVDGLLEVAGTLNGSGTNNLTGTNNMSGTNNLSGDNNLTGPTTVAGNFEIIAGGLFKAGDTVINPDGSAQFGALAIGSDGKLTAGLFKLNPDGSAEFGTLGIASDGTLTVRNNINVTTGGKITAGSVEIDPAGGGTIRTANATIADNGTYLQIASPNGLQVTAVTTLISSPEVRMPSIPTKLGATANVYIDESGQLHRIS